MIETAVQRGNNVYAYGKGNRQLFVKSGELHGYTSTTVNIRRGKYIYVYDERGMQKSVKSV